MTALALPVGVRVCRGGLAKGITLGETPCFGIASLLFLDLGEKEAKSALVHTLGLRGFDLVPGFTGQSGIESNLGEEHPTLGMRGISCHEAFCSLNARQLVHFWG
jgi:hypothetical protein